MKKPVNTERIEFRTTLEQRQAMQRAADLDKRSLMAWVRIVTADAAKVATERKD